MGGRWWQIWKRGSDKARLEDSPLLLQRFSERHRLEQGRVPDFVRATKDLWATSDMMLPELAKSAGLTVRPQIGSFNEVSIKLGFCVQKFSEHFGVPDDKARNAILTILLELGEISGSLLTRLLNNHPLKRAQTEEKSVGAAASVCAQCGGNNAGEMTTEAAYERGYSFEYHRAWATFPCPSCGLRQRVDIKDIPVDRGVRVQCTRCRTITRIPPSVWCGTCKNFLNLDWRERLTVEGGPDSLFRERTRIANLLRTRATNSR